MKKKLLILTLVVCAFMMLGSVSVFAADTDMIHGEKAPLDVISNGKLDTAITPADATPSAWENPYLDVLYLDWFYDYVRYVSTNGMMTGYAEDVFAPNDAMTRAMVVTVLYRLDGSPYVSSYGTFRDVPYGQWYSSAVEWAAKNGIVNGMGNGTFAPNAKVTREQFVTMLYRYANFKHYNTSSYAYLNFPDTYKLSSYAQDAMEWAVAEGIINGSLVGGSTYLQPQNSSTRAQVAKMLSVFDVEYNGIVSSEVFIDWNVYDCYVGGNVVLYSTVTPVNAYSALTWTSSNNSVATVNSRGVVTGKKAGTATITATTIDGNTSSATVTVHPNAYNCLAETAYKYGSEDYEGDYGILEEEYVGDWYYHYGFYYSPNYDQVMLYSYCENMAEDYSYQVQIWLNANTNTHEVLIFADDDFYGVYLKGSASLYAPSFTRDSGLSLANFGYQGGGNCYDYELKSIVTQHMNDEIHWLLDYMEWCGENFGFAFDAKDIGFKYYN